MKTLVLLLTPLVIYAQGDGTPVTDTLAPPPNGYQSILYYSGTNLIYMCKARAEQQSATSVTVSTASNANPVSFTATAHGFGDFATHGATTTPTVRIQGCTGGWTAINGVWLATITSANAFTIAVDSTAFGAFPAACRFDSRTPRWNASVWSVSKMMYDGSSNLVGIFWPVVPGGLSATNLLGGRTFNFNCSNRATLSWQ
jgi:hypothetical protein